MIRIPNDLKAIILDYAATCELVSWLNSDHLDWEELAMNPNAIDLMIRSPYWAHWNRASANGSAWPYLRDHLSVLIIWDELADSNNPEAVAHVCANIDKFDDFPSNLSANPHAIEWLENNPYYIDWDCILYNSAAESLLRKHGILDKLPRAWQFDADMTRLCSNPAPWALKIVEANIEHVRQYHMLSANPSALPLLLKYSGQKNKYGESIDHAGYLSRNSNPLAIKLITCMPVEIDWKDFSENPAGYEYLNEHREQIDMKTIARNPKIFEPQWPWRVYEDWCSWENACACNVMD